MQSRLARALPALALIVAALGASCSKSSDSTSPAPPATGPALNFAFPAAGTVANPGTSNKHIFPASEIGSWSYHCIPHQGAGMVGTVNVVASGAPEDSQLVYVGVDDAHNQAFRFSPATVTINAGGYVRWANASSMTIHTVSR